MVLKSRSPIILSGLFCKGFPSETNWLLQWFFQMNGKDHYIVIIGGEVDPSTRGHEGAGGFCNDLILVHEDSLEIQTIKEKDQQNKVVNTGR